MPGVKSTGGLGGTSAKTCTGEEDHSLINILSFYHNIGQEQVEPRKHYDNIHRSGSDGGYQNLRGHSHLQTVTLIISLKNEYILGRT